MRRRGRPRHPGVLTPREAMVADLVARGLSNREVAGELGISEPGVKYHLTQIYAKLDLAGRDELAAWHSSGRPRPWWAIAGMLGGVRVAAATAVAGVSLLTGALWLTAGDAPPPETCEVNSAIVPANVSLECYDAIAALPPALAPVTSRLLLPPASLQPVLDAVAVVRGVDGDVSDAGRAVYLRYTTAEGPLELLQGPMQVRFTSQTDPLIAGPAPTLGWFEQRDAGSVLTWCPYVDASRGGSLPEGAACPDGFALVVTGLPRSALAMLAVDLVESPALTSGNPSTPVAVQGTPRPTPVPYPTPRGESVPPRIAGLPLLPGAVQVDAFTKRGRFDGPECEQAVQAFETPAQPEQVFPFYIAALPSLGFTEYAGSSGVAGRTVVYTRQKRDWVIVGTAYVARDGETVAAPPPGFQGKGVPFANRVDGKSFFWVVTAVC